MTAQTTIVLDNPPHQAWRVRLPFVRTSFARNLEYYALLWPVWWLLGIEQILLPFFILYETGRWLIASNWRVRLNTTGLIAILLAVWWIVPVFWADRGLLDAFLKETATIWAQALILILFWNRVHDPKEWHSAVRALLIMAVYTAVAGLIYMTGLWRGSTLSLVGRILPDALIANSSFFTSISIREFGAVANEVGLLSQRLQSFSLSFSSLSMLCLLLIPIVFWRFQTTRGALRLFWGGVVIALIVCLFFTESRISYAAFAAGVLLYAAFKLGLLRRANRPLVFALTLGGLGLLLLAGYFVVEILLQSIRSAFVDLRPGSWLVRINVYRVTLQLLPEHLIAGWGVPVRIPGLPSDYSAGTHSSYLGVLFQHGIIGLLGYLALWLSIWKSVFKGLSQRFVNRELTLFWFAIATAFFTFNIREIADSWWFDQSLTFVLWIMWGVALTASRCLPAGESSGE